ncbi:MAG: S41 family peptidase [Patescibacteria group bacterium]
MTLVQVRKTILILALTFFAFGTGFWFGERQLKLSFTNYQPKVTLERKIPEGKEDVSFSLFWDVWDRLEQSYLDKSKIDYQKMVYGAISGMVASLGDPYTVFLPPQEQKQSKEDLSGAFEGVGIQLGYKDSKIAVISPLSGTPAEKAGVKAGDLILKIKDEAKNIDKETAGMTLPEAVTLIRGPKGTEVSLTMFREGKDKFEVKLKRETIVVRSVEVTFRDNIAHLKLLRFGERTYQEWEEAVGKIEERRAKGEVKGVILDLRNNPGGFLQGSVFIASEFLGNGVVVKQEKSRDGGVETFSVNRKGRLLTLPLVVLINQGSASASEIVAGTLKERSRAKIVGEKSFGKGTVQEAEELTGGAGLHITVARWLLPSGKSIDKEGITPDFEVKMDEKDQTKDPQLEKAIEILLEM